MSRDSLRKTRKLQVDGQGMSTKSLLKQLVCSKRTGKRLNHTQGLDLALKLGVTHRSISPELKKSTQNVTSMSMSIKRQEPYLNEKVFQCLSSQLTNVKMTWIMISQMKKSLQILTNRQKNKTKSLRSHSSPSSCHSK